MPTWSIPPSFASLASNPGAYFLHYFQSQGLAPTDNECVTTSVVMAMNMMEDRVAGYGFQADLHVEDFIRGLDAMGIAGWRYRFPTHSWLPGMMPVSSARRTLRNHAARLRQQYGRSYRVETRSHLTLEDLIRALEQKKIILLHGAWKKTLRDPKAPYLALLGGMPHTMLLVGYQEEIRTWNLLNPGEPWLKSRESEFQPQLFRMSSEQLFDFWGRRFLFYPPRFATTSLSEES